MSRTQAVLCILVCLGAGALFIRVAAGRWRDAQRRTLADVDRALAAFAAAMRGRFQPGRVRVPRHPLLGEIRAYGAAEVEVRGLRAVVGVDDPGGDHADDRTRIRVLRPEGRAWRVQGLRLRARPGPGADHHSGAAFARAFEVSPAAAVPDAARAALMRLAGGATALDLEPGALSFVAAWQDRTTYVADTETLRALVAELGDVAVLLLEPV